jgi:hypothetical protein
MPRPTKKKSLRKKSLQEKSLSVAQTPTKSTQTQNDKSTPKVSITLINGQGQYNMYVIPGNQISDEERLWVQMLHVDGKCQPRQLESTRVKIGKLAQIRLNFMNSPSSTSTAAETSRIDFLQTLYKNVHKHLYKDVGKWTSYIRRQPCNVFVLRHGFSKIDK